MTCCSRNLLQNNIAVLRCSASVPELEEQNYSEGRTPPGRLKKRTQGLIIMKPGSEGDEAPRLHRLRSRIHGNAIIASAFDIVLRAQRKSEDLTRV